MPTRQQNRRDRLEREDMTRLFTTRDLPAEAPGLTEVEITPEMRQRVEVRDVDTPADRATQTAAFKTGARGQALKEGARKLRSAVGSAGRGIAKGVQKAGDVLAQEEVQMALGQFGQAFGQGDPTSPATILGGQVQQDVQSRADAEVMSRLLAGEDPADIPQDVLNLASPRARTEALRTVETRAERAIEEEGMEFGQELQTRLANLEERGLDLRQEGLDMEKDLQTLEENEIRQRIEMAEEKQAIENDWRESVTELNRARAAALETGEEEDQAATTRNRRNLIGSNNRYIENRQQYLQSLQGQLERMERDIKVPKRSQFERGILQGAGGVAGQAALAVEEALPGDISEVQSPEMAKLVGAKVPDEYFTLRGRIAETADQIQRLQQIQEQLITQQAQQTGAEVPEGSPEAVQVPGTEEEATQITGVPTTISSADEIPTLEPGTIFKIPAEDGEEIYGRALGGVSWEELDLTE